ncbi:hypothetical protein VPHF99_0284 [Vibrio phage F99]
MTLPNSLAYPQEYDCNPIETLTLPHTCQAGKRILHLGNLPIINTRGRKRIGVGFY